MKKQTLIALVLLLLIPVFVRLSGVWLTLINPERAAGHAAYVVTYQILSRLRIGLFLGSEAMVVILWFVVCYLVIRSKQRSAWWLLLAFLGPFGFAILFALADRAPVETDLHERFVRSVNPYLRAGYQLCIFVIFWMLAYQAMVLKRDLMIRHQAAVTGMSTAQIIDLQNASSGMWAFAEGNEVMYMVVLLYLLWPLLFNLVARVPAMMTPQKAR